MKLKKSITIIASLIITCLFVLSAKAFAPHVNCSFTDMEGNVFTMYDCVGFDEDICHANGDTICYGLKVKHEVKPIIQ